MGSLIASWFPTQILMLRFSLILVFPGVQTIKIPLVFCTLNRTVGESVQMQLKSIWKPNIREIEWVWYREFGKKEQILVSVKPNTDPDWYDFEEKYKERFHLNEMTALNINNLTVELRGEYKAKIKHHSGESNEESFTLCVYDSILQPEILIVSSSNTSALCNVTLECATKGATENLTVTWLGKFAPGQPEQKNSWKLDLRLPLPLSQGNSQLTCVVSNPADQKNATLDLESICLQMGSPQRAWPWIVVFLCLVVILGAGVWFWKRRKMETKKVTSPRVVSQALPTENCAESQSSGVNSHDAPYAEVGLLRIPKTSTEKDRDHGRSPQATSAVHTVYEKIRLRVQGRNLDYENAETL